MMAGIFVEQASACSFLSKRGVPALARSVV
jgi:hypothetical protein